MATKKARTQKKPNKRETDSPIRKDKSFVFRDIINVTKSTGFMASNLLELRNAVAEVSEECIFHHIYRYFVYGHITEQTNDFAHWASESLEESALAEQLSNIDPYSFRSTEELRKATIAVLDYYIENYPEPRPVLPGYEFYFCEAVSYVFPAGIKARNLAEFLMAIKYIDASSIYYHFFEARTRLRKESDDFSKWIKEVSKSPATAEKLRGVDPFMSNLEGIREQIIRILEEAIREEMEVVA